jgi:hypothetical protein
LKQVVEKSAQRLAAQRLGRVRYVVTILTGNLKTQFNVFSPSLGQVSCSGVLGRAGSSIKCNDLVEEEES